MAISSERFRDIVLHALKRMEPQLRAHVQAGNPLLVDQTRAEAELGMQQAALFGGLKLIFDSGEFDRFYMLQVLLIAAMFFAENLGVPRTELRQLFEDFKLPANAELIWTPST